ncbi:TPM domain-containing protein [Irregularibacter muris]|uniref:TPM domain-containing protein n=1 Tax=Irregularibacter muris TaxID=1796619 RepID=A0AAE3HE34_9FIRM|nr:TPM domain-containing protein [Irregularibacter muris]MCR1897744.1 TPM domain-containing protein [Irregularibacter muris]
MKTQRVKRILLPILFSLLLVFVFIPFSQTQALANLPSPTQEFYVYDEANIIDGQVAQYIVQTNEELFRQTGAQVVVAVINSLEGENLDEYSNQLYRHWGIGDAQKNNGVLLLVALEERMVRIEVGYGLEGAIPDGRAGEIRDRYILPNFQQQQYSQGILQGFQGIINLVQEEYQVDITPQESPYIEEQQEPQEARQGLGIIQKIIIAIVILVFIFIDFTFFGGMITFSLFRGASRGGFGGGRGQGGNRGGGGSSGGGGASGGW